MSASAEDVRRMYEAYPYPSAAPGDSAIEDAANHLAFLFPGEDFAGKTLLDAGCGTGQRLTGIARRFPRARIFGVDMTTASLEATRRRLERHGVTNVELVQANLLELSIPARFDVITSTGVVHHLEDPARGAARLAAHLAPDGVISLWHYHALGEHQRLLERTILQELWAGDRSDLALGRELLTDLGYHLEAKRYGSTSAQKSAEEVNQIAIDVDAYLHPIVNAYRFDEGVQMFRGAGVDWVAVDGINTDGKSQRLDLALADDSELAFFNLDMSAALGGGIAAARFRKLDKAAMLRVIELHLKPSGFTVIAGKGRSLERLGPRVRGNVVPHE